MTAKKKSKAVRADEMLVNEGMVASIDVARALIMEGRVSDLGKRIDKPSELIKPGTNLHIKGEIEKYVSRGAHKLERAYEVFGHETGGAVCIDVGASTGGFTDVMLRHGSAKVYAVDVGYNQLDYKLRSDKRVIVMERVNARSLSPDMFDEYIDYGATDVSFISLKLVLPAIRSVLKPGAGFTALVKPQFEAEQKDVGEKGVVREKAVHLAVLKDILEYVQSNGWQVNGLDHSPIRGPVGNIEFLLDLIKSDAIKPVDAAAMSEVAVEKAYDKFITNCGIT